MFDETTLDELLVEAAAMRQRLRDAMHSAGMEVTDRVLADMVADAMVPPAID